MKLRRLLVAFVVICMMLSNTYVQGAVPAIPKDLTDLTKNNTSSITVEQAIVTIMTNLDKSPNSKTVNATIGQKVSVWAQSYVSDALAKGWLPSTLPKLSSNASKKFVAGFFLSCTGYKVFQANPSLEQEAALEELLSYVAGKATMTASNSISELKKDSNKVDVSKLLKAIKTKSLGGYIKSAGWQLYSVNKLEAAAIAFRVCIEAGQNGGTASAGNADAYYGYGALMAHNTFRNYQAASINLKKAIELSPNSSVAKNAANLLKKLPPLQLGLDYMPERPISYEELLAAYADGLYLNVNSVPKDFVVKDGNGEQPSEWAKKFVNYMYYKKLVPSIPTSFKDSVPRYWAASFAARVKFLSNYEYDKYYSFDDLDALTADDRMFINIAIDRNLFPMPQSRTFNPSGSIPRKELRSLINSSKKPGEPHKSSYSKRSYDKIVDTYYVDNGLIHFAYQNDVIKKRYSNIDMVNFGTVYHYSDDPHKNDFNNRRYKDEGTKLIRTRFDLNTEIKDGISLVREKNIMAMVEFDGRGQRAYMLIKDSAKRQDMVNDLVHLTELYSMDGVHLDFEHMPGEARESFSLFIEELSQQLKPKGKLLTTVVGAYSSDKYEEQSPYDLSRIGKACDYVKVILYDDFPVSRFPTTGKDGPISRIDWIERILKYTVQKIPPRKILLGVGAYGIDFNISNKKDAKLVGLADIKTRTDNAKPETIKYLYSNEFECPYIEFTDVNGESHRLWYENKESLSMRMDKVHKYNLAGIFYFWVGSDSQDLFDAITESLR